MLAASNDGKSLFRWIPVKVFFPLHFALIFIIEVLSVSHKSVVQWGDLCSFNNLTIFRSPMTSPRFLNPLWVPGI